MNPRPGLLDFLRRLTRPWRAGRGVRRVLAARGYWQSVRRQQAVDAAGREIPWFTYAATTYLEQLDFTAKTVFEFGAGNSTLFWARRAARVVSVENNRAWHEHVRARAPANVTLHLVEDPAGYARVVGAQPESFDIIVVDGIERRACCRAALPRLRAGGLIILDNADWHQRSAAVLRAGGLLGVEFSGLGPINSYAWTTTLFFDRQFDFPRRPAERGRAIPGGIAQEEPE